MRKKSALSLVILLGLLHSLTAIAQLPAISDSIPLSGNWLATDGSNRFLLGLYDPVACYKGDTWQISSIHPIHPDKDHWQYVLRNDSGSAVLDIRRTAPHTIIVTEKGRSRVLRDTRTYNYGYRPVERSFKQPLFRIGMATLKGYINIPGASRRYLQRLTVQLNYEDCFTGETDYYLADLDSLGRFSISLPVLKPQLCVLTFGDSELGKFLVQPGNRLLIAVNTAIVISSANPDYDKVVQRIGLMGDDAEFNDQYQHFSRYSAGWPDSVRSQYNRMMEAVDKVYTPGRTESRFIDYIKQELKYSYIYKTLYGSKKYDSAGLREIYREFLRQESQTALIHDCYYKMAGYFANTFMGACGDHPTRFSFLVEQKRGRIMNEYGPLLPPGFAGTWDSIQKAMDARVFMNENQVIRKYFNGSKKDFDTYVYLDRKITDQLFMESQDSQTYRFYNKQAWGPSLHFAANLDRLILSEYMERKDIPSTFRLDLFAVFTDPVHTPQGIVDTLNRSHALLQSRTGIRVQHDSSLVKEINDETAWQKVLRSYRGKIVVVRVFPGRFRKDEAVADLHGWQQLKERYKGKDIVFLTCIQQRDQSDKVEQLLAWLRVLEAAHMLNHIIYTDHRISLTASMKYAINGRWVLYDTAGEMYHPDMIVLGGKADPEDEVDNILAGRGIYFEGQGDHYFAGPGSDPIRPPHRKQGFKIWTLYVSSGNFRIYSTQEPDRPSDDSPDSIFNQIGFTADSQYTEHLLSLHWTVHPEEKKQGMYYTPARFEKQYSSGDKVYTYRFERSNRQILVYDREGKLFKTYRVVQVNDDILVLELLP